MKFFEKTLSVAVIMSIVLVLTMSGVLYQCSKQGDSPELSSPKPMLLSKANQDEGSMFARVLYETAVNTKNLQIDFSDTEKIQKVAKQVLEKVCAEKGYKMSEMPETDKATPPKTLNNLLAYDKITDSQKYYINKIEAARVQSNSYAFFSKKLVEINNEIAEKASAEDKALLLRITSSLHYGLETMNRLVNQGVIPGTPEKIAIEKVQVRAPIAMGMLLLQKPFRIPKHSILLSKDVPPRMEGNVNLVNNSWWNDWGKCAAGSVLLGAAAGVAVGTMGAGAGIAVGLLTAAGTYLTECWS